MEEVDAIRGRKVDLCGLCRDDVLRPGYPAAALQVEVACERQGLSKMSSLPSAVPTVKPHQPAHQGKTPGGVGEEGALEGLSTDGAPLFDQMLNRCTFIQTSLLSSCFRNTLYTHVPHISLKDGNLDERKIIVSWECEHDRTAPRGSWVGGG
jgi:hypothetical protein